MKYVPLKQLQNYEIYLLMILSLDVFAKLAFS